jgi:hypothetical protein
MVNTFINIKRCNWATRLLRKSKGINCVEDIHSCKFGFHKTEEFCDQLNSYVTAQCKPFTMKLVILCIQKLVRKCGGSLVA